MKIFGSNKNTSQEEHLSKPDSTSSFESDSLRDDAWDARYFGLILELEEENASRYESQTLRILKDKSSSSHLIAFIPNRCASGA